MNCLTIYKPDKLRGGAGCHSPPISLELKRFKLIGETKMFNKKSDYALNKRVKDAIVYVDANGKTEHLAWKDFANDSEFQKWKEWSDKDYHASEKEEHVYANHTLSLEGLSEAAAVQSTEAELFSRLTDNEYAQNRADLMQQVKAILTEKQYRRLSMYYGEDMSVNEIAAAEGISQPSVSQCISAAQKNISGCFQKHPINLPFYRR